MGLLVYYSTKSGNTHRFIDRLGLPAVRIPVSPTEGDIPELNENFLLITPTYGGGQVKGAVPPQVKRLLSIPRNVQHMRGVIACGNTNFGAAFALAGPLISRRFAVPHLFSVEIFGTPETVNTVRDGVGKFWTRNPPSLIPATALSI